MPPPERFDEEFNLIAGEGLAPVAARAFKNHPEYIDSPAGLEFRRIAFDAELREMAVDARGAEVLAGLGARHIPVAVAKGPATPDAGSVTTRTPVATGSICSGA
jgi:hypothetical protein